MQRRRFDHLMLELSLALDRNVPRYPLWIAFKENGANPEFLTRGALLAFFDDHLVDVLERLGHAFTPRQTRRLRRAVSRFDPALPSPYERMARI
jgi:hypothetical protein